MCIRQDRARNRKRPERKRLIRNKEIPHDDMMPVVKWSCEYFCYVKSMYPQSRSKSKSDALPLYCGSRFSRKARMPSL